MEFYKVEFTYVYFVECRAFLKKKNLCFSFGKWKSTIFGACSSFLLVCKRGLGGLWGDPFLPLPQSLKNYNRKASKLLLSFAMFARWCQVSILYFCCPKVIHNQVPITTSMLGYHICWLVGNLVLQKGVILSSSTNTKNFASIKAWNFAKNAAGIWVNAIQ